MKSFLKGFWCKVAYYSQEQVYKSQDVQCTAMKRIITQFSIVEMSFSSVKKQYYLIDEQLNAVAFVESSSGSD